MYIIQYIEFETLEGRNLGPLLEQLWIGTLPFFLLQLDFSFSKKCMHLVALKLLDEFSIHIPKID